MQKEWDGTKMEINMPKAKIDPETIAKILQAKEALKALESTAILRIAKNPTIFFVRQYNAEKQAMMELAFSEKFVENPEVRKAKFRGYAC